MDMLEVTALVPRNKVGRFYALVSRLVDEVDDAVSPTTASVARTEPWREGDDAIAKAVVDTHGNNVHRYLRLLAERAGQAVSYSLIDDSLGMTWNERTGVQGALGRTAARYGRDKPWTPDYTARTAMMPPATARMFLRALGDRGR